LGKNDELVLHNVFGAISYKGEGVFKSEQETYSQRRILDSEVYASVLLFLA